MRNLVAKVENVIVSIPSMVKEVIEDERGDIGIGPILGIVLVVAIFAFVVMPSSRSFAEGLFSDMQNWFDGRSIFPTS